MNEISDQQLGSEVALESIAISLKRIADSLAVLHRPAISLLLDLMEKEAADMGKQVRSR